MPQNYKLKMEKEGWVFREMLDPLCKGRYFGHKNNFTCFIDIKKATNKISFWQDEYVWEIKAPKEFSEQELIRNSLTCDKCDTLQESTDELLLVNVSQKYCMNCIQKAIRLV